MSKQHILDKETEDTLVKFCLHEKLHYPTVRSIFITQTPANQLVQLKDMEETIKLPYQNNAAYDEYLAQEQVSQTPKKGGKN